jgi:structural maintenance of chromosome 4
VHNSNYIFCFYNRITSDVGTIQGEVEQISLMKPKAQGPHDEGFLEYLEDIIGTNQYVEKIEETYKQ